MRHLILALTSLLIGATGIVSADDDVARHDAEASAAGAAAVGFVDDWNTHDMKRFAELFTEDADFVNVIGLWWHGRSQPTHADFREQPAESSSNATPPPRRLAVSDRSNPRHGRWIRDLCLP